MEQVRYDMDAEHPHECECGWWQHDDPMCEYPKRQDCPICEKEPTDWVRVQEND